MIPLHQPSDEPEEIPWELLFSSDKSYQVEILKSLLEDQEIDAVILNHQDSSYVLLGEVELYVKQTDLLVARQVLTKFLQRE
jgi:hypothetical protein